MGFLKVRQKGAFESDWLKTGSLPTSIWHRQRRLSRPNGAPASLSQMLWVHVDRSVLSHGVGTCLSYAVSAAVDARLTPAA